MCLKTKLVSSFATTAMVLPYRSRPWLPTRRRVVREGGRGLVLMRTFMDQVSFNESGNEVTMVKRRDLNGQPAASA